MYHILKRLIRTFDCKLNSMNRRHKRRRVNELKVPLLAPLDDGPIFSKGVKFELETCEHQIYVPYVLNICS